MRGAEDPADQLPAPAPVELTWNIRKEDDRVLVQRLRNGRVVYQTIFNTGREAVTAYESYTRKDVR